MLRYLLKAGITGYAIFTAISFAFPEYREIGMVGSAFVSLMGSTGA